MCGILGQLGRVIDPAVADKMMSSLSHRGPDSSGQWIENDVWLGHQRLAIIELSSLGHQPMLSECGRYVLVFNGEIYNYKALSRELISSGFLPRGGSDTEVVLNSCVAWGLRKAVERFEGMFALALYDRQEKRLELARDQLGLKPLYYTHNGDLFAFSSELAPLLKLSWVDRDIDCRAQAAFFKYRCVPAPLSIYKSIKKLMPGSTLEFSSSKIKSKKFWNLVDLPGNSIPNEALATFEGSVRFTEQQIKASVELHMQSDVPYGAFLSGGIDSTLVTAMMQEMAPIRVKTFCMGFPEKDHDESRHASRVAKHLNTDHYEYVLDAGDLPDLVDTAMNSFDEPFADNSAIPTFLVSKFARNHVKVCLSGDGGDELFGGYPRYFWGNRIDMLRKILTPVGASAIASLIHAIPKPVYSSRAINAMLGKYSGPHGLHSRAIRFASYLKCAREQAYSESMATWQSPSDLIDEPPVGAYGPDAHTFPSLTWAEEMMMIDQLNYLPDDILVKLDRASMAVSLEARTPLLTPTIAALSWRLPLASKLASRGDAGKLVLREILKKYIPEELVNRPKQGFGMPLDHWLRSPLRDWAESLLTKQQIESCNLQVPRVKKIWSEHLAGADRQAMIWTILMYSGWHQKVHSL